MKSEGLTKALQPTATRCAFTFFMIKNVSRDFQPRSRWPRLSSISLDLMSRTVALLLVVLPRVFASASDSRPHSRATEAYHQRLSQIIDSTAGPATDKLTAHIGAMVHFSFRIDAAGRISRLRVFAERASDRPAAQVLAQAIRTAHFPPPPPQVIAEQGHPWYDFPELVFLVGAD
jgi:hypothetical protein